ncbi:hypothetical protein BS50DRAFT_351392 [Corynespora cassiicola Philippines]|uniref:Uncharacterized protein n=1 Tax=Corynespora cassiicola Philippines TaxID=1448308 RepID=A0A2T2NR30_CORCC|nr:hypothetical protein BS50DRAFT_351392 [Corynespora cassiicola Philippines]
MQSPSYVLQPSPSLAWAGQDHPSPLPHVHPATAQLGDSASTAQHHPPYEGGRHSGLQTSKDKGNGLAIRSEVRGIKRSTHKPSDDGGGGSSSSSSIGHRPSVVGGGGGRCGSKKGLSIRSELKRTRARAKVKRAKKGRALRLYAALYARVACR